MYKLVGRLLQLLCDVLHPSYVMPRVAYSERLIGKLLPTPHEAGHGCHLGKTFGDGFIANLDALLTKQTDRSKDGLSVLFLAQSSQCGLQVTSQKGKMEGVVFCKGDWRSYLFRFVPEDGSYIAVSCFANHDGNSCLDDASLLRCYLRKRVAQELNMVEADVGDDAEHRRDDVRAVEPAA